MQSPSGRQYTPAEIRDRTELVLQGRFARVLRAADVLAAACRPAEMRERTP